METLTTLVCLFHDEDRATAAVADLREADIPESSIAVVGGEGDSVDELDKSELASLGMPDGDYDHLKNGLCSGGLVVSVTASDEQVNRVEAIFGKHHAEKMSEAEVEKPVAPFAALETASNSKESVIPVVEEALVVGKRTVDQGGVRLYRRVIEIPVEESVVLRDEHVRVNRVVVDRPVTDLDAAFQPQTIELTETAEEVVVEKVARVVEEVVVNKDSVEHTETVNDTVRRTQVDVEDLLPHEVPSSTRRGTF